MLDGSSNKYAYGWWKSWMCRFCCCWGFLPLLLLLLPMLCCHIVRYGKTPSRRRNGCWNVVILWMLYIWNIDVFVRSFGSFFCTHVRSFVLFTLWWFYSCPHPPFHTDDGSYCHEKHNYISSYFLLFWVCVCVCVRAMYLSHFIVISQNISRPNARNMGPTVRSQPSIQSVNTHTHAH